MGKINNLQLSIYNQDSMIKFSNIDTFDIENSLKIAKLEIKN